MHPSGLITTRGIDVHLDGTGASTVLMLHGWPDTHRLWDATVAALRDRHRCVRFTLPGFDPAQPPRPTSLAEMTALIAEVVDAVSPHAPVTVLQHDWGCVFGYEYAQRHPDRVARIVAVDIGDHNHPDYTRSLAGRARRAIFAYQIALAAAWVIGRHLSPRLGDRLTRAVARAVRCPTPAGLLSWRLNWPYAMRWLGLRGGLGPARPVDPACPVLYLWGQRKPFMFHSAAWLARLAARPGCAAVPLRAGHWVMLDQPAAFHQIFGDWLAQAPAGDAAAAGAAGAAASPRVET